MYTKLCTKLWVAMDNLKHDARGVTAIEYAILAAVVIAALTAAGAFIDFATIFGSIETKITDTVNSTGG